MKLGSCLSKCSCMSFMFQQPPKKLSTTERIQDLSSGEVERQEDPTDLLASQYSQLASYGGLMKHCLKIITVIIRWR